VSDTNTRSVEIKKKKTLFRTTVLVVRHVSYDVIGVSDTATRLVLEVSVLRSFNMLIYQLSNTTNSIS